MKEPAPDVVIAGKYILEGQLATGGMGSVWLARHVDLEVPVAIKFMGPEVAESEEGRNRFEREAKAAAFLQSPNVVNVQDYGVDDGLAYIAMELLLGEDLEDRLFRVGRLSLEETLSLLKQASKALRRAQDIGIVHRDLKPQNLFLAKVDEGEEILKILDFGIAKETGPTLLAAKASNTGQIIGSPHYMSPEAVRGVRDIDHRSDLWSLGVIVFQCVTGRLPFPSEVVGDVMGMILADPLPRATDIAPDLPPEMDEFFEKALCRDRTKRFQTAREMTEAFADILGAPVSGFSVRPPLVRSTPPPSDGAVTRSPSDAGATPDSGGAVSARVPRGQVGSLPGADPASERATGGVVAKATTAAVARPAEGAYPRTRRAALMGAAGLAAILALALLVVRSSGPQATGDGGPAKGAAWEAPAGPPSTATVPVGDAAPAPSARASAAPRASSEAPAASATPTGSAKTASKAGPVKSGASAAPKGSAGKGTKPSWGF